MNLSRALKILGWKSIQNKSAKNDEEVSEINSGRRTIFTKQHSNPTNFNV